MAGADDEDVVVVNNAHRAIVSEIDCGIRAALKWTEALLQILLSKYKLYIDKLILFYTIILACAVSLTIWLIRALSQRHAAK